MTLLSIGFVMTFWIKSVYLAKTNNLPTKVMQFAKNG